MKTYTKQDLHIISDPVRLIRKDPNKYLSGAEKATGEHLAARMMSSLIWLGALPAEVTKRGPWWVISSDKDWLITEDQVNVDIAFSTIIPLPTAGRNSHRAEILLSAFADVVVTSGADGIRWVKGDSSGIALPEGMNLIRTIGRQIAFRLEDSD